MSDPQGVIVPVREREAQKVGHAGGTVDAQAQL